MSRECEDGKHRDSDKYVHDGEGVGEEGNVHQGLERECVPNESLQLCLRFVANSKLFAV